MPQKLWNNEKKTIGSPAENNHIILWKVCGGYGHQVPPPPIHAWLSVHCPIQEYIIIVWSQEGWCTAGHRLSPTMFGIMWSQNL